jgi:hypothetical protein
MVYLILLLAEVTIVFLLSRIVCQNLFKFMSINFFSFVFSPGIILHELSHLLMATVLFVPVGDIDFTPRKNGNGVRLGSVEIAKTDPVRRSLIGFAPVLIGLTVITGIVYLFSSNILFLQSQDVYIFIVVILIAAYLLFVISNTMFSSRRDMEGTAEILIVFLIIFAAAYFLGFRFPFSILDKILTKEFVGMIQKSTLFLIAPIGIDLLILGVLKLFIGKR